MKFYKIDTIFKEIIFLFMFFSIGSMVLAVFFFLQMQMSDYEKIKYKDYHVEEGYVSTTKLKKRTEHQYKSLEIKLIDGRKIYLIEKEKEFPQYPKIPDKIQSGKKITYLINKNKNVLSLKIKEKEYVPIHEVQQCENINELRWILIICGTMGMGIFFVYMVYYMYQLGKED